MQYMGGKGRAGRHIAETMLQARGDRTTYLEPFLGGCHVLPRMAPHFQRSVAADAVPDVVMLWQDAMHGWEPPAEVSRELYAELRHAEPSALRAFVGFGCSFGGKWWGGYASNARGDNFPGAARTGVLRKAATLDPTRVTITLADYRDHAPDAATLVYCDPPYAGTTSYTGAGAFDPEAFWTTVRGWVGAGALVFVSEYDAPTDWVPVWQQQQRGTLAAASNAAKVTERLYVHESQADEALGARPALF